MSVSPFHCKHKYTGSQRGMKHTKDNSVRDSTGNGKQGTGILKLPEDGN